MQIRGFSLLFVSPPGGGMEIFMNSMYTKRKLFIVLISVSLLSGVLLLATNHLDFLIAAVEYGKMNVPNIAYFFLRLISSVILPAVFIVPSLFPFGRIRSAKTVFITCGILYLLTLTWIFYFLGQNSFAELFNNAKISEFQSDAANAFVSSYVFWDTYSWAGILFTLAYGIFYIYAGLNFDDNRIRVRIFMIILLGAKIIFPLLSCLFGLRMLSLFWITNNYAELISFAAFAAAIFVASTADNSWVEFVWDQRVLDHSGDDNID